MNVNELMQYISWLLIAVGVMAFVVSVVTQVIKSWPGLEQLPTSAVVIVLSLVLCPAAMVSLCAWKQAPITWYMIFACFIAAFVVALVSMNGWEKVNEIWQRTRYPKKE